MIVWLFTFVVLGSMVQLSVATFKSVCNSCLPDELCVDYLDRLYKRCEKCKGFFKTDKVYIESIGSECPGDDDFKCADEKRYEFTITCPAHKLCVDIFPYIGRPRKSNELSGLMCLKCNPSSHLPEIYPQAYIVKRGPYSC